MHFVVLSKQHVRVPFSIPELYDFLAIGPDLMIMNHETFYRWQLNLANICIGKHGGNLAQKLLKLGSLPEEASLHEALYSRMLQSTLHEELNLFSL
jgi:hypothetical protein